MVLCNEKNLDCMTKSSNYDKLHDQLWSADIRKSGTKYERLAAFVLKSLKCNDTVVHDIKLVGKSTVKHQIDITVESSGRQKRVLIECKDFDISGKKVGLSIVRNFWGVIDDVHPDEAIVITCNGFSSKAMKYAKNKNIKLSVLREFVESDWEGRIKTIAVTMHTLCITKPTVEMYFPDQENSSKYCSDLSDAEISSNGIFKGDQVFLNLNAERIQLTNYIEKITNAHPRKIPGLVCLHIDLSNNSIEVEKRGEIGISDIFVKFEVVHGEEYFKITSDKVARLILSDITGSDMVIFEEDLRKFKIDAKSGEVITY